MARNREQATPERIVAGAVGLGGLGGYLVGLLAGALWVIHRLRTRGESSPTDLLAVCAILMATAWLAGAVALRTREAAAAMRTVGVRARDVVLGMLLASSVVACVVLAVWLTLGRPVPEGWLFAIPLVVALSGAWLVVRHARKKGNDAGSSSVNDEQPEGPARAGQQGAEPDERRMA